MEMRHFLPVPVRVRHADQACIDGVAALGPLCLRAKNLAAEIAAMVEPGEAVLWDGEECSLPAAGLSFSTTKLAGVHALRAEALKLYPGIVELDFEGEHHPLGFAIPPAGAEGLAAWVALHCEEERDPGEFTKWRSDLAPPFEPCSCCRSALELRREQAAAHPLAAMLADAMDRGLQLHTRVAGKSFAVDQFLTPSRIDLQGAVTAYDREGRFILRLDPGMIHGVQVGTTCVDRELCTVVRVFDLLGMECLRLLAPGDACLGAWRDYCAMAG